MINDTLSQFFSQVKAYLHQYRAGHTAGPGKGKEGGASHVHADRYIYSPDGTVPAVIFDAYRYDNNPLYFVNIDRIKERINVWKFDTANNIYNYQVSFNEPESEVTT